MHNAAMDHLPTNFKTPGQLIEWLLTERGWTKKVLSIVLAMDEAGLSRIISGKRPLSAELAVALEEVFEVPAESFMALQKSFELAQARIAAQPDPKRATRARLFGGLPVNEMIKPGFLPKTAKIYRRWSGRYMISFVLTPPKRLRLCLTPQKRLTRYRTRHWCKSPGCIASDKLLPRCWCRVFQLTLLKQPLKS